MYDKDYDVFLFERVWEFRAQVRNCSKTRSWAGAAEGRCQADESNKTETSENSMSALRGHLGVTILVVLTGNFRNLFSGNDFGRQCP